MHGTPSRTRSLSGQGRTGSMRVGILGSGLMGGKLGTLLARAGHGAVFSYTRSPDKLAGPSGIRTVFPPAGGICPRSRLGGRAFGLRPTGTVATTAFVELEITLTVLEDPFATKSSPVSASKATPSGLSPTRNDATTLCVASEMTLILLERRLATNTSPLRGSYAI